MTAAQVLGGQKRRRRIDAARQLGVTAMLGKPGRRVSGGGDRAGMLIGQFWRANEWCLRPAIARHCRDFRIVGRNDDTIEQAALLRGRNRVNDNGLAGKQADILAWYALAAAAGRDDR